MPDRTAATDAVAAAWLGATVVAGAAPGATGALWAALACGADGAALGPQAQADAVARPWHELWRVDEEAPPIDFASALRAQPLQPPPVDGLRRVCASFSKFTAVGVDNLHPKHVGRLCDAGLAALSRLMTLAINAGRCPSRSLWY